MVFVFWNYGELSSRNKEATLRDLIRIERLAFILQQEIKIEDIQALKIKKVLYSPKQLGFLVEFYFSSLTLGLNKPLNFPI